MTERNLKVPILRNEADYSLFLKEIQRYLLDINSKLDENKRYTLMVGVD